MNMRLEDWPSLASDNDMTRDDEDDESEMEEKCKGLSLSHIFTDNNHPNLTSVVMMLMMGSSKLELIVSWAFADPDEKYVRDGALECPCEMFKVTACQMCTVGCIEKVLVAALKVLWRNGCKDGSGTDYRVIYEIHKSEHGWKECTVIQFKFNDVDVQVKLVDDVHKGNRVSTIYMYVYE